MTDLVSLEGRSIVVTGAAQGVGLCIAQLCLELGAAVTAIDMQEDVLRDAFPEPRAANLLLAVGSITDEAFVARTVDDAAARFGKVDGLVNNAGITRPAMAAKMDISAWKSVLEVNLTGAYICLQAVGRHMIARNKADGNEGGAIVNVASDAGRKGTIGQINYSAAKSGLLGVTMSAALEWARYGIRVNTISFGLVETPMTETVRSEKFRDTYVAKIPLGRWATAQEAAKPVCFMLSGAASFITGQHLSVNGGSYMSG